MPFDPLRIVDRDVFSADGSAFLGAQPPVASPPVADAPSVSIDSEQDEPAPSPTQREAPPTFEKLLGVSPRFLARHARSATEATLLMDIASAVAELDVLLESLADQLSDRARITAGLVTQERQVERKIVNIIDSERTSFTHATLLVLQVQARKTNKWNVVRLLERFQTRFQALLDLRFLLAQELEKQRACLAIDRSAQSRDLKTSNGASSTVWREELVRLEGALLERLNALEREKGMSPVFTPLTRYEGDSSSSKGDASREICWPALSNPGSEESKRSENNVCLSTTFELLQSSSTTMPGGSANDITFSE